MRLRSVPTSVVISVSFIAVFCLALIYETPWGQVILYILPPIPCVWWWYIKYVHQQNGNNNTPMP